MNGVKPIPAELLTDGAVLLTPTGSGYLRDNLDSVRIVRVSAITDYTTGRTRDCTELVMYFDWNSRRVSRWNTAARPTR